jgi:DNA-binding LacI/PurR family transcriptional regulator
MGKYITLTEIGKRLGISTSTVSRALQDHPRISQKTKDKVRDLVSQSGFIPNQYSQILKDNKSYLIGVIIPDLELHFFTRILSGINSITKNSKYSILLGHSEENSLIESSLIEKFIGLRVDGVIAALSRESRDVSHYEKLTKQEIPLVFYDRVANFLNAGRIISDDYNAAFKATEYLIKTNCSTIVHITASGNLNNSNNRLYGYLDALNKYQIPINEELIFYFEFDHSSIKSFLTKIIKKYPMIDGVFVFNDYVANTVVHHLMAQGIKIPEEISVIGFSNEPIPEYMTPRLSTVEDVAEKMGQNAAKLLINKLEKGEPCSKKIILEQKLVLRDTTRPMT